MSRPVVYVTLQQFCEADERPRRLLQDAGVEVRQNPWKRRLRPEELFEALRDVDAALAGVEPYDAQLLSALPQLRCISRCGVGTETIDLDAAARRGVSVFTTADEVVEPVAQMTVSMILALARNLSWHLREMRAGEWIKRTGALLSEWTIGLVGFGRIGRAVAGYLRTFEPSVLAVDPQMSQADVPKDVALCDLTTLLRKSDVVSLHASRRPQEGALIGPRELAVMKRGSFLVNTARGFLVDEQALYEALRSGRLGGAALDVFETEPYAGPLARLPQVICTPHVSSLTKRSRTLMELKAAEHIIDFFSRKHASRGSASAASRSA